MIEKKMMVQKTEMGDSRLNLNSKRFRLDSVKITKLHCLLETNSPKKSRETSAEARGHSQVTRGLDFSLPALSDRSRFLCLLHSFAAQNSGKMGRSASSRMSHLPYLPLLMHRL